MKNQKVRNGLNRLFFSFLTWIAICTGIFTAIAVFPEAPEGETSGGWEQFLIYKRAEQGN